MSARDVRTLQEPTSDRPVAITRHEDGSVSAYADSASLALGARVHLEVQNPADGDVIWTVPAHRTFTGSIVILGALPSGASVGVDAATGGSQASVAASGETLRPEAAMPVTTTGGEAGNELRAVVAGAPWGVHLIVDGYVK